MEVELKIKEDKEYENIFYFDYKGQSLDNNVKFKDWQNKMVQKYGKNVKLYKCLDDNIYFYGIYKDNAAGDFKYYGSFQSTCPVCNHILCGFCFKYTEDCCLTDKICFILFYLGLTIIKRENQSYTFYLILFFSPMCTLFLFIGIIAKYFFHNVKRPNGRHYTEDDDIGCIKICINGLTAILLTFIFAIHDYYFKIFILLISIFSKFYPLKYYLGIIKGGLSSN